MFRPDPQTGPGAAIRLTLAPPFGDVTISSLSGAEEVWLAARRQGTHSLAALETLVLSAGMVNGCGDPAAWLQGDRNRALLAVLQCGYGAPGELWARCPDCGEVHEVPLDVDWVLDQVPDGPGEGLFSIATPRGPVDMHLPTGRDLADPPESGLLARIAPGADPDVADLVEAEISVRDPCSELLYSLICVNCGAGFVARLDPLALVLGELDRGGGVFGEIDRLARTYHWSEADILAMPAWRRRLYLTHVALSDAPSEYRALS